MEVSADSKTVTASVNAYCMDTAIRYARNTAEAIAGITVALPDHDISTLIINVPEESISHLVAESDMSLAIDLTKLIVTFDALALQAIYNAGDGGGMVLTVSLLSLSSLYEAGVSAEDLAIAGNNPLFDISVAMGGNYVTDFLGGRAVLTIPYTPASGQNILAIIPIHINADGDLFILRGMYHDYARFDGHDGYVQFATKHFSIFGVGYNPVTFTDVPANRWYRQAVDFIGARRATAGASEFNFYPDRNTTREEFLVMMMVAYGIQPDNNPLAPNFTDATGEFTGYLAAARALGLVNGVGDNRFAPTNPINRQEMTVLVYNVLELIGELPAPIPGTEPASSFQDFEQVSSWARPAMEWMVESGTIIGDRGLLTPRSPAQRSQMAQLLFNLLTK